MAELSHPRGQVVLCIVFAYFGGITWIYQVGFLHAHVTIQYTTLHQISVGSRLHYSKWNCVGLPYITVCCITQHEVT